MLAGQAVEESLKSRDEGIRLYIAGLRAADFREDQSSFYGSPHFCRSHLRCNAERSEEGGGVPIIARLARNEQMLQGHGHVGGAFRYIPGNMEPPIGQGFLFHRAIHKCGGNWRHRVSGIDGPVAAAVVHEVTARAAAAVDL